MFTVNKDVGEADPTLPDDKHRTQDSLHRKAAGRDSNLSHNKSRAEPTLFDTSPEGSRDGDGDDSDVDSDPEEATNSVHGIENDNRVPTVEEDRETLLRDLGQATWNTPEAFKAAHDERLKRCFMADRRDQNRNIFHWLALKLLKNSLSNKSYLRWIVESVLSYDPDIITQLTADSQKANCLQIAIQQRSFDLVDCLRKVAKDGPLKKAFSQGNSSDETCLHLVAKLQPPRLKLVSQILEKADRKVIAMRRSTKHSNDKSEDLNTVLHDFVHINQCFTKGYIKILKQLTQDCPEAMKVQNGANETPLQFHLRTRNEEYPGFEGLEFANPPFEVFEHSQAPSNDKQNEAERKKAKSAAKAGQHLLDEAFSQPSHEDACACIYGDKKFDRTISFQPASPINSRIEKSHPFLNFHPILSHVELTLVDHNSTASKYDSTMHPANFANSDSNDGVSPHKAWKIRTNSVVNAFSWFRKQNVKRILKVVVVDDSMFPCSDETIEDCLRSFDVRYLNWNKDDFCPAILRSAGLQNIRELWLSWSGRNSVLYSWSCKYTGLPTMEKLDIVHLETRTSTESGDRDAQNLKDFEYRLQDAILNNTIEAHQSSFMKNVTQTLKEKFDRFEELGTTLRTEMLSSTVPQSDAKIAKISKNSPIPIVVTIGNLKGKIMDHLKEEGRLRKIQLDDQTNHSWIDGEKPRQQVQPQHGHRWVDAARRLAEAVNKDKIPNQQMMRPIKICLIDDGVTPGELNAPSSLKDGWPSPSTRGRNTSRPYYCSEKGHGTKMARLIQMMCPHVWIYVAKVDMHRNDDASVATSAAQAVKWAIEKQVDVISMSWTVKGIGNGHSENEKAIESLDLAIQDAANKDIIMMCSVENSAHYGKGDVYPQKSDTKKLLRIGSGDENGDRSNFVKEKSFDYLFPGEVTIPGLLTNDDAGSSVATAIAAGMAAMILWCAEHHSATIRASGNEVSGQIALTTPATGMATEGELRSIPRTAPQWDFRRYGRMKELFKSLKAPRNDKFVDITTVINHATQHIDDMDEMSPESQSTCTQKFITRCKEHLPVGLRWNDISLR